MTQLEILIFWLPLFASWLLMTAEGPTVTAAINRLPEETIMLAAQGIVVSLEVTIESPIINMLATATALVKDRQSYEQVRRFAIHWAIVLTIIAAALAFTPLFDVVVVTLLGTPLEVARWVRPGLQIMTLWSAAISWRRFLQGVLIHFGYTRVVAWGTAVRLAASGGTAIGLALYGGVPGVVLGALALMAGVTAEAIYATIAVRPLLQNELAPEAGETRQESEEPLSYSELFWFHLPLASTAVLTLLAHPLVAFALARLDNPTLSLAAWPLIFQLILMARAAAMALPEAVIALTKGPQSYAPLRRFAFSLSGLSVLGMLLLILTPALPLYLRGIQDAAASVAALAERGTTFFVLYPALFVLVSWLRGLLIKQRATRAVNGGMALNLTLTALLLAVGIQLEWRGILTAALALNVAIAAELLYLAWRTRKQLDVDLTFFLPRPWSLPVLPEGG